MPPKSLGEQAFVSMFDRLQLRAPFLKLFRAIVVDCWTSERHSARELKTDIDDG